MGFMDSIFGGTESAANPYAAMGTMMPGAYSKYYRRTIAEMGRARRYYSRERRRQFKLLRQAYDQQRAGLQGELRRLQAAPVVDPSIRRAHTRALDVQLGEGERRTELGAARRGFYSSTVPGSISGVQRRKGMVGLESSLASTFGAQRSQQMEGIRTALAMGPAQYTRSTAQLRQQMPGFQIDPRHMLRLQRTRALAQPWGAMRAPIEQYSPGLFGGVAKSLGGAFFGGLGGSIGAGMMG